MPAEFARSTRRNRVAAPGTDLYDQIAASANRLDTLAELAKWEESPETDAAVAYRYSSREEITIEIKNQSATTLCLSSASRHGQRRGLGFLIQREAAKGG